MSESTREGRKPLYHGGLRSRAGIFPEPCDPILWPSPIHPVEGRGRGPGQGRIWKS